MDIFESAHSPRSKISLSPAQDLEVYDTLYDMFVDRLVYHNYILFSTTTDPATEKFFGPLALTVGFCGKVFIIKDRV